MAVETLRVGEGGGRERADVVCRDPVGPVSASIAVSNRPRSPREANMKSTIAGTRSSMINAGFRMTQQGKTVPCD